MKRTLYAKYNRTRTAEFQTCTKMIEDNGVKYVEKEALTEEAVEHILSFAQKYTAVQSLYKNIMPCKVEIIDSMAKFEYVEGETIAERIEKQMDTLESVLKQIKEYLEIIFSYRSDRVGEFVCSEQFESVFGKCDGLEGAVAIKGADIDTIFDNFICKNNNLYVIDYEWYFDFLIPVDYIKFRSLFYFYSKNHSFFQDKIKVDDFLQYFGIDKASQSIFLNMDEGFQQYVHGKERCNIYTRRYEQPVHDINGLLNRWHDVEGEIAKRDQAAIELTGEVSRRDEEINRLNQHVQNIERERNIYADNYNQVLHSYSWKLTKPLRVVALAGYNLVRKHKITSLLYDGMRYLMSNGIRSTYRRIKELYGKPRLVMSADDFRLSEETIEEQRSTLFKYQPKFSILVPLYNTPDNFLCEMIESVIWQTYENWELCLADGSDEEHNTVGERCQEYVKKDSRIVYRHLDENRGISENTNACIQMATGDYIGLFDHDDLLTQDALYEVVKCLNKSEEIDVVYTDEDKYLYDSATNSGKYVEAHCKSDFNLDLLRSNNYICHFFVVRKQIIDQIGGFRKEYDGSQDYDLILRCVEKAKRVEHIPKVLYHWRIHANSTAGNPQSKMYCYEAGKHAIESHLQRQGISADVEMTEHWGLYRVKYSVKEKPLVSIIIPNKDEKNTLQKCINSILEKTTYHNYEIIVVENNSETEEIFEYYKELSLNEKIRITHWKGVFNYSKINNYGVGCAKGEYIVLLNNDVEIISEDWIGEMLSNCQRAEVGITGAKLLYPNSTVQHCGIIIGLGGIAGHTFVGIDRNHPGYFGRACVQQNLSAVTAACLMVKKSIFDEVGGLEESLQVAFNDVDFCLKVRKAGYLVVMNPNVLLYHYESKSRGVEDTLEKQERFASEVKYMAEHWTDVLKNGDPYYNKNLTLVRSDFSIKGKDEVAQRYV